MLQVQSLANPGQPIVFHVGQADAEILSQDAPDVHTYGNSFKSTQQHGDNQTFEIVPARPFALFDR